MSLIIFILQYIGSYIQKLTPMFQIPNEIEDNNFGGWSPQKVSNVHCMVQVVRALVAPSAPAQVKILALSYLQNLSYYYI